MKNKTYILTLFVIFIGLQSVKGQELPPIESFSTEDYRAENQNWAISQTTNKFIYVANNKGLLEFTGADWKLYPSPNQTILRSVHAVGNRIYTGCYMEFGYWKPSADGQLRYTSLSEKLASDMLEDEQIWSIVSLDNYVVFQSLNRIYSYNLDSQTFSVIEAETTLTKMIKADRTLYFQKYNQGIFKIESGEEKLVSNDAILKSNIIVNVFSRSGKLIIQTKKKGFFVLEDGQLNKWDIPANDYISGLTVYSSICLNDGSLAIGTISNGIVHLSASGEFDYRLNQDHGLLNNTVLSLFEDSDENLWLGLDNGINCINSASPYRIYKDKNGRLGSIYTSRIYKDILYLGTNQGLFFKPFDSDQPFELIEATKGQVWCLTVIDDRLFCGHDSGTFEVEGTSVRQITFSEGTWDLKPIPNHDDLILQGNYNGLNVLERKNGKWSFRNKLTGFDMSSKYVEILNADHIFVSHEYKGVFKLEVDETYRKVENLKNLESVSKGLHSSLSTYENDIFYASNRGVFKYNLEENVFLKDSILSKSLNTETYKSGKMVTDGTGKLWFFSENNIFYVTPGHLSEKPKVTKIALPSTIRNSITGYESIMHTQGQNYLFGTSSGYIMIDLDKVKEQVYNIKINSVNNFTTDTDANKNLVAIDETNEFTIKSNNFAFAYSIPEFEKYLESEYQYKLKGDYDQWSNWSKSYSELFKNLASGDYTFEVRGRVGNTPTENTATYSFSISKPWYISNLLIFIYILAVLLFSIFIHNVYKSYYKKQKSKLIFANKRDLELKELETEQQLMQLKNEKLQQDIENKNRELAISTMSLIKKNEFLNSIKEELKSSETGKGLKSVVKIIDKNINNTDDWKFFQEAFNNADKDFLKKVKSIHSKLTPNDLKLCAYLRLNLTSKEIAPLLNISSRSVEVKRYRLRKKMDLPHEASLTNYILEI